MKKVLIAILCLLSLRLHAQNVEGQLIAAQFGEFQVPSIGQAFSFAPASCQVTGGGKNFQAAQAGVPIKIVDADTALTEIATPSSVFADSSVCTVNVATTHAHTDFYFTSGTGGLQEALNYGGNRAGGPNTIILNAEWYTLVPPGVAATVIASVHGSTAIGLVDVTTTPYTYYAWNGSAYAVTGSGGAVASVFGRTGAVVAATNDYTVSQVNGAAPLASPALTGVPTVPTATPGTNTTQAASTAFVIANGSSLPTASSIGQVPTATGSGTTYTAQTPLGGTTWYYPVEWFGAVGDWNGTTGTDNTTAIQNCINAVQTAGQGQCLLQAKRYKITGALSITHSSVGIAGVSYGAVQSVGDGQFAANVPASTLVSTSQTADFIDATGSGINTGQTISYNRFNDFTMERSVIPTIGGLSKGLNLQYTGGVVVDHVWSEDSVYGFYFLGTGAVLTGSITNSGAMWGFNGFAAPSIVVGFNVDGTVGSGSLRIRDCGAFANNANVNPTAGTQAYGMVVSGTNLNDIMVHNFETGFMYMGEQVEYGSGGGVTAASDIHFTDTINDSFYLYGFDVEGVATAQGGTLEIKGGWNSASLTGTVGAYVHNSSGVSINSVQFYNIAASSSGQNYGIVGSGSSRLSIVDNTFLGMVSSSIYLTSVSGATVTGNTIAGTSVAGNAQTMIEGISLTRSVISANALSGYASVGVSLDSGSADNVVNGLLPIDPTHITTPTVDSGTGDILSDGGSGGSCGTANIPCTNTANTFSAATGQTISAASGPALTITLGGIQWTAAGSGDSWNIDASNGAPIYSWQDVTTNTLPLIVSAGAFAGLGEAIGLSTPANGCYQWNNANSGAGTNDTFLCRSAGGTSTLGTSAGGTQGILGVTSTKYTTTVVGSLPSASTAGAGATYVVTDANSFTVGTCTGSGSDTMLAVSNGTTWTCH